MQEDGCDNRFYTIFFFFQAEDGIRDGTVTGVQTCALPIYELVAEGGAHALEILNGDARRVPAHLGTRAEVPEAAPRGGGDLSLPRAIKQLLALGAAEPVRSPGAALVDEDDVALAPDARKGGSDRRIELARRLPRTPGEDEERIGLLATADRRHARDGEADLPPAGDVRILRDGEHAAL